ncbi:MAG: TetR family transcriptional regulator [Microlunatus sp.]|nr:TetR family transcriptional regulator [Microlunatus sp.]
MRIVGRLPDRHGDELTARTRLRDAALECFAVDGFGVSVRVIAERAHVSPGLIRHHFGSKDALRGECDEHALSTLRRLKESALSAPAGTFLAQLAQVRDYSAYVLYILRSVRDGGPAGRAFLEHMIADAETYTDSAVDAGIVRPSRDSRARVRYLVMEGIGGLIVALGQHPKITMDNIGEVMTQIVAEVALPRLELFTEGLLTDRRMLDEYLLYIGDPPATA